MGKFKKVGLFLGALFLTLGFINFISAQFPTKAPYSAVSRDFRFMQDVQIDGSLVTIGTITETIGYLYSAEITATPSSAFTVNWIVKHVQRITITGVALDVTFTDPATPCKLVLIIVQGDGDDTIDWTNEASILWPGGVDPVLTTANGAVDMVTFYFDGTSYLGVANYDFK
jgi:hypothetical protein